MISTSDCAVLLRSWRTKRSGIMREMSLSMRAPSVSPRGAVPWVPSNEVQRGNGIGETPEEGGKLNLIIFLEIPACSERGGIYRSCVAIY